MKDHHDNNQNNNDGSSGTEKSNEAGSQLSIEEILANPTGNESAAIQLLQKFPPAELHGLILSNSDNLDFCEVAKKAIKCQADEYGEMLKQFKLKNKSVKNKDHYHIGATLNALVNVVFSTKKDFNKYLESNWGETKKRAQQYIDFYCFVDEIQNSDVNQYLAELGILRGTDQYEEFIPQREGQIREIKILKGQDRIDCWKMVIDEAMFQKKPEITKTLIVEVLKKFKADQKQSMQPAAKQKNKATNVGVEKIATDFQDNVINAENEAASSEKLGDIFKQVVDGYQQKENKSTAIESVVEILEYSDDDEKVGIVSKLVNSFDDESEKFQAVHGIIQNMQPVDIAKSIADIFDRDSVKMIVAELQKQLLK
jgi:hypothetical protein